MDHKYLLRAWSTALALTTVAFLGAGCGGKDGSAGEDPAVVDGDELAMVGEALVGVREGSFPSAAVESAIGQVGQVLAADAQGRTYHIALKDGVSLDAARAQIVGTDVVYVEPNWLAHTLAAGGDAYFGGGKAYSTLVEGQITAAWTAWGAGGVPVAGNKVVIAVIDTGVQVAHPDLVNKIEPNGTNVVPGATATDLTDADGHGTQVAGVAAAEIGNTIGVAGIAASDTAAGGEPSPARTTILPVKVSDATHPPTHATIAAGLNWVVNGGTPKAHVALISLGSGAPSYTLQKAIEAARAAGVLVVAPAGNNGTSLAKYPAAYQGAKQKVLAVTSVDGTDTLSSNANYGAWVNLAAPGEGIVTTTIGSAYTSGGGKKAGTSFSAAFTAGAAALLWSKYPYSATPGAGTLTLDQLRAALVQSVDSVNLPKGKTLPANAGRLNVQQAMAVAANAAGADATIPTALLFTGTSILSGGSITGTVVLDKKVAGSDLDVTLATSGTDAAAVTLPSPAKVTIKVGSSTGTFKLTATSVTATKVPVVTATANSVTASATLTVNPPGLVSVTFDKTSVTGGATLNGTLTFNVAPASDTDVAITTSNTAAIPNLSGNVTVKAKALTAKFTLPTKAVGSDLLDKDGNAVTVTATQSGGGPTATQKIEVLAPVVASVTFDKASTVVWETPGSSGALTGTVKLNGKTDAAGSGQDVILTPSDSGLTLKVGSSVVTHVTVPADSDTATFTVQPEPVPVATTFTVQATISAPTPTNVGKTGSFKVVPALAAFSVTPASVSGDGTITGTITLADVAPGGGVKVDLAIDPTVCGGAGAPAAGLSAVYLTGPACSLTGGSGVPIAAGQKSGTVQIGVRKFPYPVAAPVTASFLGVDKTVTATSNAPVISSVALSAKGIAIGNSISGTITLSANAVTATTVDLSLASTAGTVSLSSDDSTFGATAQVSIASGSSTGTFYVKGLKAGTETVSALVTGAPGASAKAVKATVAAATLGVALTGASGGVVTAAGGIQTVSGTVTLSSAAAVATTVTLTTALANGNTAAAVVAGGSVVVAKGATSQTFTLNVPVAAAQVAGVTVKAALATGEYKVATETVTVKPTVVLTLKTVPTHAGAAGAVTVTLGAPATGPLAVVLTISTAQAANFALPSGSQTDTVSFVASDTAKDVAVTMAAGAGTDVASIAATVGTAPAGAALGLTAQ